MTASRHRMGPLAASLVWGTLLAACQPLPHPFADDRPPAGLLKIRDSAGVSIARVDGVPDSVATKLGGATATALLKRDIPASDKTASVGSYLLYGRVVESRPRDGKSTVTALWRLYDSRGEAIGEKNAKFETKTEEWVSGADTAVERLASLSADELAPLLADEPITAAAAADAPGAAGATKAEPADKGRLRVAVGKVSGAPGDGGKSLAAAVVTVLKRQDLTIVEDGGKADLYVEGEVVVAPPKSDKQHVKIVWRVRRADGGEIGTVGQENEVPRGLLDGAWGDIAYNVAIAAGGGLLQLVARGGAPAAVATPAPKS